MLIDSKGSLPTGFTSLSSVVVVSGEWILYSEENYSGDQINVKEGDTYKQGDGQKDTPAVLAAKSFYAHFPNVFCQMEGYSNEYRGSRARDADGNTCKSECRSDDADKEPTCEIEGTGEKKSCGIPRCIWDSQCYTGLGVEYRGMARNDSLVNATIWKWIPPHYEYFDCNCQAWAADEPTKHPGTHPYDPDMSKYGLRSAYCRNPDPTKYSKPWCIVGNIGDKHTECSSFLKTNPMEVCPYLKVCNKAEFPDYYTQ